MLMLILIGLCLLYIASPLFRCFISHIPQTIIHALVDTYDYIRYQKWKLWKEKYSNIYCFIGMFGRGKTLSMTKYAVDIYNHYAKYGEKVRIVSNYEIKSVPYIPLVNFEQIVELGNMAVRGEDDCIGTIVCVDEIEMLFSHRKFASFPIEVLSSICQSRKAHIMMLTSCQRWKMQDAAIRDITTFAINCKKVWRFQLNYWFDAWDMENSTNADQLHPIKRDSWFVFNKYFKSYDTTKLISKQDMQDFISNDELLQRRYANSLSDPEAIKHPSRKLKKKRKIQKPSR